MALAFENIRHAFGKNDVLKGVTLTAQAGDITCLLGPSGSGKSTMLRLAAGLEVVQAGAITLDGNILATSASNPPPEKRPIGLVFQDSALFPHMTVAENIGFGITKSERSTKITDWLGRIGLDGFAQRYPHTLSGGQQQRIALARALAPEPRVLLMDEPYASIDSTLRRSLREAARHTLKASGAITIMVTHDPEEAMEMGDQIAVLDQGRIVQAGTPQQLYDTPIDRGVAMLFGHAQRISCHIEKGIAQTSYGDWDIPSTAGDFSKVILEKGVVIARPAGLKLEADTQSSLHVIDIRYVAGQYIAFVGRSFEDSQILRIQIDKSEFSLGDQVRVMPQPQDFFVFI